MAKIKIWISWLLTLVAALLLLAGIYFLFANLFAGTGKIDQEGAGNPLPVWQPAHSFGLDLDYEFKTDVMSSIDDDDADYQLSLVASDWGIYIHRLKGFAKAFIFQETPSAELYRLLGDSDVFKWNKRHKLIVSEPTYSIYTKDGDEHLRQDFTIEVTAETEIPEYFPEGLKEPAGDGSETRQIAAGNYYYITKEDIYMVHFLAPAPLSEKTNEIIGEVIEKMTFGAGQEPEEEVEPAPPSDETEAGD